MPCMLPLTFSSWIYVYHDYFFCKCGSHCRRNQTSLLSDRGPGAASTEAKDISIDLRGCWLWGERGGGGCVSKRLIGSCCASSASSPPVLGSCVSIFKERAMVVHVHYCNLQKQIYHARHDIYFTVRFLVTLYLCFNRAHQNIIHW